jgi:hypothetical protein
MDSSYFIIDSGRWVEHSSNQHLSIQQYQYLDSIATFCNNNNIQLFFFQSPFREGILDSLDMNNVNTHIAKIAQLAQTHHFQFINGNTRIWKDDLFTDATHLNKYGAKEYTEFCLKQIP